ncbi:oligosaccharide flippase family protein [Thermodesulfobacteriota bacterium]
MPSIESDSPPLRVEIFRNVSKMLGAQVVQIPLQVIRALVIPKILSPETYGLWRSLFLITRYSSYLQMGTHQIMVKEMAYLAGKGEYGARKKICNNTFYYNLFASLFVGFCLILVSFFTKGEFSEFYRHGFRIVAFVVLAINLWAFYFQLLRIEKEFTWLSVLTILTPVINAGLAIGLLIYIQNVLVLAYALAIANSIPLVLAIKKSGWPKFQEIQVIEMWRQIRVGFPLMLIPLMFMAITGVDQVMIITFLKPEELGYYGVALSIQQLIYFIPGVLGSTLVPYLFEDFGRTDSALKSSHMFEKPTLIISLACAFAVVGTCLFIHLPIKYYLTQYLPGLTVLYILLPGIFSVGLIMVAGNFIVISGKEKSILRWQVVAVGLSIITNFAAIKLGYGIVGVAVATFVTYFVYSTGILYIAFSLYIRNKTGVFKEICKLYVPLLYLFFFFVLITQFIPNAAQSFVDDLQISCLRGVILMLTSIPLIVFYDSKLGVLATVKRTVGW